MPKRNLTAAFAQRHEITDINPVQFVSVAGYEHRKRVLTNDELKTVWNALMPPVEIELIDLALTKRTDESDFVFPSPRDNGKPIKPAAMTRAFGRMKKALKLGDIRIHDSRRTGATNLTSETLGFPHFTVSKVLNHTSDSGGAAAITGIYDQNEYLPEKRRALEAWAVLLQGIVSGKKAGDNVVGINSAKQ